MARMLQRAAGLSERELQAIAGLEQQVVAADGGRLKLEWATLRRRSDTTVEDLLWWEDGRLLGFIGLYRFGSAVELAGMVAPDARGRGIGSALLDAATELCRQRGYPEALLIVPRDSTAGRRLAERRGGRLHHSEHALTLIGDPAAEPGGPALSLRPATRADLPVLEVLLEDGFGWRPEGLGERLDQTMLIEYEGTRVGTICVSRDGEEAGIYGFVIESSRRGRGLGRETLRRVCRDLRDDGVARIGLEVETRNDRALGLYTSVGFTPVSTEDYFELSLAGA
jgi:ribosomal protein S18 acetylase RimI-like enzyme